MARLAKAIEATEARDTWLLEEHARVDRLRRRGAVDLHAICRGFVDELNGRLTTPAVLLDPPEFSSEHSHGDRRNLFQIHLRGRLLQIEFGPTEELYSTENYRDKYVLEGTVRSFNQGLLDRSTVDEQSVFYCVSGLAEGQWHCFDGRTYRTRRLDGDVLAAELERLV